MNVNNLVWIDLEMTGLDPKKHHIIELATVVTDKDLNVIAEGPVFAIKQDESVLSLMDKWNVNQHTASGLLDRVKNSHYTESYAEERTIEFLMEHTQPGKSPMCGNSICQDRRFLHMWMPALEKYFHYRQIDVSSFKEIFKRWFPEFMKKNTKHEAMHIALSDIYDSINEMKLYREFILACQAQTK